MQSLKTYTAKRLQSLTPRQRVASTVSATLLFALLILAVYYIVDTQRYKLDDSTRSLIGSVNKRLAAKLTYDTSDAEWRFNANSISQDNTPPSFTSLQAQVGDGAEESDTLYATTFSKDPSKGVTFYDTQTQLSFTMAPDFPMKSGKSVEGRLVYPMQRGTKLIYTPKNNGMKEDIIIPRYAGDELQYSYTLKLPKTLRAEIQDNGSVGIFSADPILFSDIAMTKDSDAEKLRSAREDGNKNHLLFAIPAPFVVDSGEGATKATARFTLDGDSLTITAKNMDKAIYPASIDPSVVVTSSTDFLADSNPQDSIDFSTTDQVYRSTVKTGVFSELFTTTTSLPSANGALAAVLHNDKIYAIGGTSFGANVYHASINSNGTLGAWQITSSMNTPRSYAGATVYNGSIYVWGGYNTSTNTPTAGVEYAKIHSDGTLGAWNISTNMHTAVCRAGSASYDGYLYAIGGSTSPSTGCTSTSTGATSTVQYAPINADGSVGTWKTTSSVGYGSSGAVISPMAGAYNGFIYAAGGHNNSGGTAYSNVQYAAIQADGSLSSWIATTSMPAATHSAGFLVQDGAITTMSNQSNSSTQYTAQIYANGKLSPWLSTNNSFSSGGRWGGTLIATQVAGYYIGGNASTSVDYSDRVETGRFRSIIGTTASFTSSRERMGAVVHKGCIVVAGGYGGGGNTYVNYAQSAPINSDGNITTSWPNKSFSTARADLAVTAYNGYLYVMGGYNAQTSTYYSDVQYVPINDDCTLGTWASTTSFDTFGNARGGISAVAHNGYLYVTGGKRDATNFDDVRYAPINEDGTIGSWSNTTDLPTAVNRHRIVVSGGHMYAIGGTQLALPNVNNGATTGSRPSGAGTTNVYVAPIAHNGTVGAWQSTTSLPVDLYEFGAAVSGGFIYVAGGFTSSGSGISTDYRYAPINEDGTIGSWTLGHSHGYGFASVSLMAHDGYLYLSTGRRDTGITNTNRFNLTSYIPTLNSGSGRAGEWANSDTLSGERTHATSTAYNGHIYTIGGSSDGGSSPIGTIERSTITRHNGSANNFITDSNSLAINVMSAGSVAYDGYLYVVGGKRSSGYQNAVQYAPIGASGALSSSFSTTSDFTNESSGREGVCVAAHKDRIYAVGGWDGTTYYNTVRYAATLGDGTLTGWSDSGNNFTTGRAGAGCTVIDGRLYIYGGKDATNTYNDVQYATINPDGSLGGWQYTTSFWGARTNFISGYSNGFLYLYGGCTTSACTAGHRNLLYTQVKLDGTLEPWQIQTTANSPYQSSGAVYGGYLYQIGGLGVASGSETTAHAPLSAVARIGKYSKLIDLGSEAHIDSINVSGTLRTSSTSPGASPVTFRSALSDGQWKPDVTSVTNIRQSADTCDTASLSYARYVLISITLDDTYNYGFSDSRDQASHITGITVNYTPSHPDPSQRLARGKYFKEGSLQALDTCS